MATIDESPKPTQKQEGTATPRHSSMRASYGIPNKPNPPAQISPLASKISTSVRPSSPPHSGNSSVSPSLPQNSVFKFPVTEPPTEQQNKKSPLLKANTVSGVLESKSQSSQLVKQFSDSEETTKPPSQLDLPTETSRSSVEDENLSPFAIALKKASKAREERILTNQPRMLSTTMANRQLEECNEPEEEESNVVTAQIKADSNPITSSTTTQGNKAESVSDEKESTNAKDTTVSQEMQQSKDSPQNEVLKKKVPVTNLIKQFSGDLSTTQEATGSTHANVEKTYKNFDKQHTSHNMVSTNTEMKENPKSVANIAQSFEGKRGDDGTYNWRDILKKSSVPKSSIPNVEDKSESTNVYEKTANRQMQGYSFTKKPSKTSILASKFEQNAMIKSESIGTIQAEQQNLSEVSTDKLKEVQASMGEQKSTVLVKESVQPISNNENVTQPLEDDSNNENGLSSANKPPRRQSAVVMCEEDEINLSIQCGRSSVVVDTDYWKSPEHAPSLPAVSEVSIAEKQINHLPDITTDTEILPEPVVDILPPPIMPVDEELASSIEDLPLPEFLPPPPEIDDFMEIQDLPPPAIDFPDSDFSQDIPSFDIAASSNTDNSDTFELPSPLLLPPDYDDTGNFVLPSHSLLPPHNMDNFELPSPSQLPPNDDFEFPSPSQLPPLEEEPQLPPPEEQPSDMDDSGLVPKFHPEESGLENKNDENEIDNETLNSQLSITALPPITMTSSNSMPKGNTCDDITLQTPSFPLDLSDIPVRQDKDLPSINPDQHSSSPASHDNFECESLEDDFSQVGIWKLT